MDKKAILKFRDFLRDLKPSQFDNSVGITGPVPSANDFIEGNFSAKIQAGVAEWYVLFSGDDGICTDQDMDGTWHWVDEDKFDYAHNMADMLDIYNERILRKLYAPDAQRSQIVRMLGILVCSSDENEAWSTINWTG